MKRFALLSALVCVLNACSFIEEKPFEVYQFAQMQHLQKLNSWYFEGRLALADEKDSFSASINWRHQVDRDDIELVGPLAQGRVAILVTEDAVLVDDGKSPKEYRGRVDEVMSEQLGVNIPVNALKFWMLGVNDPLMPYIEQEGGFLQEGWSVRYREMQRVNLELLPKKISVEKQKTRIKLIVDEWDLS